MVSALPNDRALVMAAQSGDRHALEVLLERHQAQIYRFGLKLCRNPDDAQDVLQDTLLTLARELPSFRGASSLSSWIYAIARSFCIKRRRRSKFAPAPDISLEAASTHAERWADAALDAHALLADKELEQALRSAIDALPATYREVIVLRDMEGLSTQEVGEVLGLRVEAVKSRLHRAREAVREHMLAGSGVPKAHAAGCPDVVALWSRELEGELSAEDCARMEQHLARCDRCRGECAALRRNLRLCRATAEGVSVPEPVQKAVRAAIQKFLARTSDA